MRLIHDIDTVHKLAQNMDNVNIMAKDKPAKTYHHGDLRRALLDAGFAILDREGIEAVKIRAVARKAGVAHSAPANHFPTRDTLLDAMAIEGFDTLLYEARARMETLGEDVKERVAVFANALTDYAVETPQRYHLLWRPGRMRPENEALYIAASQLYEMLSSLVLERAPDTHATTDNDTLVLALWSLTHGYADLRANGVIEAASDDISGRTRLREMIGLLTNS
jgi:AcrR family transcriptional regulator